VARAFIAAEDARRGLPRPVGVGIRRLTDDTSSGLVGLEAAVLGPRATDQRRRYFALGRAAAHEALADIGCAAPAGIGRGPGGQPLWPDGIVGAITHAGDVAMALVGRRTDYAGLGLDIEQLAPGVSARAARLIATDAERAWLACQPEIWRTILFSAKEAVFKAMFPVESVWLGFSDAELTWDEPAAAFEARLLKAAGAGFAAGYTLRVRCTLSDTAVLSVTCVQP